MDVTYYVKLLCLITCALTHRSSGATVDESRFPDDFMFGVATASYQIEGAWNVSDKSESIWDRYTHTHKERVFDHNNGDVSADSYHLFRDDVALMRELGVDFYRFSISWPRVLPDGLSNRVSEDGVRYYNELIDELLLYNIKPVVTMYHWDLPQSLQDLGGWTNPVMADYFLDYAEVLLRIYGDRVKAWITFNEPYSFCHDGYGGNDAPGGRSSGIEAYLCGHNVLIAHGMVYRMFEKRYKIEQESSMAITINMPWMEPVTSHPDHEASAERARQFSFGWFAHPIFSEKGDYPQVMRKMIDERSALQNFTRSRLPSFSADEVDMIRGSSDFMALNHYTTYVANGGDGRVLSEPTFENDMNLVLTQKAEWPTTNSTWLKVVPWGFRKSLNWIRKNYNNPPVVITENGVSLPRGLKDAKRIDYIQSYLKAMLDAINVDGCLVIGYTYWSLIDNYEWMRGYSERFGLFEVDYESPNKTRTPRDSASYYSKLVTSRTLPTW